MEQQRLHYLMGRYSSHQATPEELKEFRQALLQQENKLFLTELMESDLARYEDAAFDMAPYAEVPEKVLQIDKQSTPVPLIERPNHRILFLRRWSWAVVVILVFGTAAYLWITSKKTPASLVIENKSLQLDIVPGTNKAILTLADGTEITLDSAASGVLAQQGSTSIIKLADGGIQYDQKGGRQEIMMSNTVTTSRGGQYQLTLPDGTKVWLNASSSITYPAVFVGKQRSVHVTGEVYFEVSKNKHQPFVVDVNGKSTVQVLGTSFNINSYPDEDIIKTALIDGSIRVSSNENGIILQPGQQAEIVSAERKVKVTSNIDLDQVMGWKNGFFHFHRANLAVVMRQLARWYDVAVIYESGIPDIALIGKMKRDLSLRQVLEALKEMGVNCQLDGRRIIVRP